MREEKIENMDFKALRKEVAYLRDELALFIRKYNDTIMNLDSDNFGKSFSLKQKNMETQIKVTAEGLKTKVSESDLDNKLESYSTIEQTAITIQTTVTGEFVTSLIGDEYVTNTEMTSQIEQTANSISASVTEVSGRVDDVEGGLSDVEEVTSQFIQTPYGFVLDGETTTFTGVIHLTDASGNKESNVETKSIFFNNTANISTCENEGIGGYDSINISAQTLYYNGFEVATQAWVTENGGGGGTVVAVFG